MGARTRRGTSGRRGVSVGGGGGLKAEGGATSMGGGGLAHRGAGSLRGGGAFLGEGTATMAILAVVRLCPKSGGGGEGSRPFPGQGEGTCTDL